MANWPLEFARIVSCTKCSTDRNPILLRDSHENVPQPGYIGRSYENSRVFLVGQNPGFRKAARAEADRRYMKALCLLREEPNDRTYDALHAILRDFIQTWPVHGNYFPLQECGLTLDDIAYCNVVRCRTTKDKKPSREMMTNCTTTHFSRWLDLLQPRGVVFIGKAAYDIGVNEVRHRGIPCTFVNRLRSLSAGERMTNRRAVADLVRQCCPGSSPAI